MGALTHPCAGTRIPAPTRSIVTELSPAHTVLGLPSSAPPRAHPKPPHHPTRSRPQRPGRFTCSWIGRGSSRSWRVQTQAPPGGARAATAAPATPVPPPPPRLPGAASPQGFAGCGGRRDRERLPIGPALGGRPQQPPRRVQLPAARRPPPARTGTGSELLAARRKGCSEPPGWAGIPSHCWIRGAGTTFPE